MLDIALHTAWSIALRRYQLSGHRTVQACNVAWIMVSDVVSPMYTVVYRLSKFYQGQTVSVPEASLVTGEAIVMYEVMVHKQTACV